VHSGQKHVTDFDFNIGSKVIEKGGSLGFEFSQDQAESQYRIKSLVNEELKQFPSRVSQSFG